MANFKSVEEWENWKAKGGREQPPHESNSKKTQREYTGELDCCPYCNSRRFTSIENGKRGHCNNCYTSFSPTVGTEYHKPQTSIEKLEILKECLKEGLSVRESARLAGVNRNTALNRFNQWDERADEQLTEALAEETKEALIEQESDPIKRFLMRRIND